MEDKVLSGQKSCSRQKPECQTGNLFQYLFKKQSLKHTCLYRWRHSGFGEMYRDELRKTSRSKSSSSSSRSSRSRSPIERPKSPVGRRPRTPVKNAKDKPQKPRPRYGTLNRDKLKWKEIIGIFALFLGLLLHHLAAKMMPGKDLEEGHEHQLTDKESLTKSLNDLHARLFRHPAARALALTMTAPSAPQNTESKNATRALPSLLRRLHPPKRLSKG
jgi:hypothetical protein